MPLMTYGDAIRLALAIAASILASGAVWVWELGWPPWF